MIYMKLYETFNIMSFYYFDFSLQPLSNYLLNIKFMFVEAVVVFK